VESNERYYRRRAIEERMAAQRAMTDTARAWHSKLAEDFAARAATATAPCTSAVCTSALAG
jgi:anti-sigma-K factor RskA